jgi:predicted transcriptional regulator
MILSQERWMELRAFKALADAGATWAEIARETGYDWRTVKRYLATDALSAPPAPARRGPPPEVRVPCVGVTALGKQGEQWAQGRRAAATPGELAGEKTTASSSR